MVGGNGTGMGTTMTAMYATYADTQSGGNLMTVRMLLPFEMGKVTSFNPTTFEETIDHPVLDIGSSWAAVKPEIREWMVDTFGFCHTGFDCGKYFIDFESEADMAWFKLRWL